VVIRSRKGQTAQWPKVKVQKDKQHITRIIGFGYIVVNMVTGTGPSLHRNIKV